MASIIMNNFQGINYREENLGKGVSPNALNVDTSKGLISKRLGYSSLFDSMGSYPTRGIVTHLDDYLYFEGDGDIYRASGETTTESDDFSGGTKDTVSSYDGKLYLFPENRDPNFYDWDEYEYDPDDQLWSMSGVTDIGSDFVGIYAHCGGSIEYHYYGKGIKRTFDFTNIDSLQFDWAITEEYKHWKTEIEIDETTVFSRDYDDSENRSDSGETIDCSSFSGEQEVTIYVAAEYYEAYGGHPYSGHVQFSISDFRIQYGSPFGVSGSYIKKFDLTDTPVLSTLTYETSTYSDGNISALYSISDDDSTYSGYSYISSGDKLNNARYVKIKLVFEYNPGKPIHLLYVESLEILHSLAYSPTKIKTGQAGKLRGVGAGNYVYMTAGGRPFKDDGTTKTDLGVEAPTSAPTLAEGEDGTPSGTYKGLVTYVNADGVESDRSPESSELTVSSKEIDWDDIPTGGSDVVSRRLYRTVDGGDVYYLITEIEDNTTTSYTDDYTDSEIQNSDYIAPDQGTNGVPPDSTIVWLHGNHMFYVSSDDQRRVYFSKVYGTDPDAPYAAYEQVPDNYYYEFPYPATGIRTFAGYMIVTGKYFTALVSGSIFGGTDDDTTIKILDDFGAETHEGMATAEGQNGKILALFTRHGISYLSTGQYDTDLARGPLSYSISPKIRNGDTDDAFLFYFQDFLYAGFTNSTGERVLYRSWDGPWDLEVFSMAEFHGGIVGAGWDTVCVNTLFEGHSDDGEPIDMLYDIRFSGQGENIVIGKIFVYANNDSSSDSLDFYIQGDSDIKTFNIGSDWSEPNSSLIGTQKEKMRALGHLRVQGDRFGIRFRDLSTKHVALKKIVLYY